jgi:hypothetical protein
MKVREGDVETEERAESVQEATQRAPLNGQRNEGRRPKAFYSRRMKMPSSAEYATMRLEMRLRM